MGKAVYYSDYVHCSCGMEIYTNMETRLSDEVFEGFDNDACETEIITCPRCKMQYELELRVRKTVEVEYSNLNPLGQFVTNDFGESLNLSMLSGKWIGEEAGFKDEYENEYHIFSDGIYRIKEKEYTVQQGIVSDIWSIMDDNQLTLFEEAAA